eukprot:PhM_4_TR2289/c0_g1_i1/m.15154
MVLTPLLQDWESLKHTPRTHRGDQPSEILPNLYLSGHPARFRRMPPGYTAHPSKYLCDNFGIHVIVNCCAAPSWAPFVVEDLATGEKKPFDDFPSASFLLSSPDADDADGVGRTPRLLHVNLAADDVEEFIIKPHLTPLAKIICAAWLGTTTTTKRVGVLVHCQMGVSRSATVLAAALLYATKEKNKIHSDAKNNHSHVEAVVAFLESRRSCVCPNEGFLKQLAEWWQEEQQQM